MKDEITKNLRPLSEDEIQEQQIELHNLWMVQNEEKVVSGPYLTQALKKQFLKSSESLVNFLVFNLQDEKWLHFHEVAQFQRRQLNAVNSGVKDDSQIFYILKKGQKEGPYEISEIAQMLEKKELLYQDQISHDGIYWSKIYNVQVFDRRNNQHENQSLPYSPKSEVLNNNPSTTIEILNKIRQKNEEIDALAGLVFIGHGNDKGQVIDEKNESESKSEQSETVHHINEGLLLNEKWEYAFNSFKQFLLEHKKSSGIIAAGLLIILFTNISFEGPRRDIASEFKESQKNMEKPKLIKVESKKEKENPSKRISAKKIAPINRTKKEVSRPKKLDRSTTSTNTKNKTNNRNIDDNNDYYDYDKENYDLVDIEDPRVREELSREMAGQYDEQNGPNVQNPNMNDEKELIDQIENGELTPEMEKEFEQRLEHYEEISDFE